MFGNETKGKKMKGYIRVSTEDQAKEGLSLENQEKQIRNYAEMFDVDLIEIVADKGLSGTHMDRPGLQSILRDLDDGVIDGVIIWSLDRFSRKALDVLGLIDLYFNQKKKILCSITEKIDTSSAMGAFVLQIIAAINELEVRRTKERILGVMKYKKENSERLGTNPFGFKTVYRGGKDKEGNKKTGKLIPVKEELELLKEIVEMREKGFSLSSVCDNLNNRGIKSKQGKRWWPQTINYIIKNPKTKIALTMLDELVEEDRLKELSDKISKGQFTSQVDEELREIEKKLFEKKVEIS